MTATKISGYRQLSEYEVASINALKKMSEAIGESIDAMESDPNIDKRWLAIGKTDIQTGFMAIIRSVAKPEGF